MSIKDGIYQMGNERERQRTCSAERREKIKATRRATALRRRNQRGFVYECKIIEKRLNAKQREELKRLFVEGKWFYNHVLSLHKDRGVPLSKMDAVSVKTVTRQTRDKKKQQEDLRALTAQERQAIVARMSANEATIAKLVEKGYQEEGELHFMSEMTCIPLKQYGCTYKFKSANKVKIGGISGSLLLRTGGQLDHVDEFANANLIHRADGYFLKVTCFVNNENLKKEPTNGKEIGLDFGIKTSITTSEGEKIDVLVEESGRLKRLQRQMFRRAKGSNNRYKTRLLIQREYQKMTHRKMEKANKILSKLKHYDTIVMQDELIAGWHRGLFGKQVQHSCLGLLKAKLKRLPQTVVLDSGIPTTKFCPECHTVNKYITMADRVYRCGCGYEKDRDMHGANNMLYIMHMVLDHLNKLPTEHREVTLTEFRTAVEGQPSVSPGRGSEKMPRL